MRSKYSLSLFVYLFVNYFLIKTKIMHYNQSCAAKGDYGSRYRQQLYRSMQRAAVNIFKTENSYEMLVFAPGRIKEHFHIDVKVWSLRFLTRHRKVLQGRIGYTANIAVVLSREHLRSMILSKQQRSARSMKLGFTYCSPGNTR